MFKKENAKLLGGGGRGEMGREGEEYFQMSLKGMEDVYVKYFKINVNPINQINSIRNKCCILGYICLSISLSP